MNTNREIGHYVYAEKGKAQINMSLQSHHIKVLENYWMVKYKYSCGCIDIISMYLFGLG